MLRPFRDLLFASSIGLLALLCPFVISVSHGAEYPTKTVQIINPFPAGASTDILARILTDKLSALLGQPVVVINKTGGGGAIGIKAVKDAAADGHTVMVSATLILVVWMYQL